MNKNLQPANGSSNPTASTAVMFYSIPQAGTEFLERLPLWLTLKTLPLARQMARELLPLYIEANLRRGRQLLREAEAQLQKIQGRLADLNLERTDLIEKLQQFASTINPIRMYLYLAAAVVALGCELTLSNATLPQLFQVEGLLGFMVACAPVAATIAIEELAGHLLDSLLAGRRGLSIVSWASGMTLAVLLVGSLAMNAHMVLSIAAAREEAAKLFAVLNQTGGDTTVTINQQLVSAAIAWVSIVVVLNSAILLRSAMNALGILRQRRKAEKKLQELNAEKSQLESELKDAQAELGKRKDEITEEREGKFLDAVGKEWLAEVEAKIQTILRSQELSLEDRVHAVLVDPFQDFAPFNTVDPLPN